MPKCPQTYNPHAGFKLMQYFATAEEKDFENIFPTMIAEEDFSGLQSLIAQMRESAKKFDIKLGCPVICADKQCGCRS